MYLGFLLCVFVSAVVVVVVVVAVVFFIDKYQPKIILSFGKPTLFGLRR